VNEMPWLGRAITRLSEASSALFVIIVLISAYEVIVRYAFGAPTIWVHEISIALAAIVFALGGPYVHETRQHIAITIFLDRMSDRARRWMRVLHSLLSLFFLSFLTLAAGNQAASSVSEAETSGTALNLPIPAVLKTVFALCCLLLAVQTLAHLFKDVAAARSRS
jgi:TRAP-type C4-dicarboxylate transport system permease small subunit